MHDCLTLEHHWLHLSCFFTLFFEQESNFFFYTTVSVDAFFSWLHSAQCCSSFENMPVFLCTWDAAFDTSCSFWGGRCVSWCWPGVLPPVVWWALVHLSASKSFFFFFFFNTQTRRNDSSDLLCVITPVIPPNSLILLPRFFRFLQNQLNRRGGKKLNIFSEWPSKEAVCLFNHIFLSRVVIKALRKKPLWHF